MAEKSAERLVIVFIFQVLTLNAPSRCRIFKR